MNIPYDNPMGELFSNGAILEFVEEMKRDFEHSVFYGENLDTRKCNISKSYGVHQRDGVVIEGKFEVVE